MSRPQGVHAGASAGNRIDASICARAGTTIERRYSLAELPRVKEAGAREGTFVSVKFSFSELENRVAIDGELDGIAVLTCQRCMQSLDSPLHDEFKVVLVKDEAELDLEPGGYEAILGDPSRLDLQVLAEDQALLALPLVPRHEAGHCARGLAPESSAEAGETQRPFGNLRNLMNRRQD